MISNQPSPVLYCNCEEPSIRELCLSPAVFTQDIEGLAPQAFRRLLGLTASQSG